MLKKRPVSFYVISSVIALLVLYTVSLFIYLKISGAYTIATIVSGTPTSEGIDYQYEFFFEGKIYEGRFTDIQRYQIGSKYFVSFSRARPSKNLLQYGKPVPDCLKDSVFSVWDHIPGCTDVQK